MLLQSLKLCLVRGVPYTTIIGCFYMSGWVAVELLSFLARGELGGEYLACRIAFLFDGRTVVIFNIYIQTFYSTIRVVHTSLHGSARLDFAVTVTPSIAFL